MAGRSATSPPSSAAPSTPPPASTPDTTREPTWPTPGPIAVSESWDWLRHDSGWSQVLWITEWPRIDVPPDFLHPLIFAPGVRRTSVCIARPLPADVALRQIRREKTEAVADSAQKARIGQLADLSDSPGIRGPPGPGTIHHRRAHRRRSSPATSPSPPPPAKPSTPPWRPSPGPPANPACELRPVYGHQMEAFISAALPLARTTF